jgi:hypothetical protein
MILQIKKFRLCTAIKSVVFQIINQNKSLINNLLCFNLINKCTIKHYKNLKDSIKSQ